MGKSYKKCLESSFYVYIIGNKKVAKKAISSLKYRTKYLR